MMKNEPFDKMDQAMLKLTQNARSQKVPDYLLKDFSKEVLLKIRNKNRENLGKKLEVKRGWFTAPAFWVVPVLVVAIIVFLPAMRLPIQGNTIQLASLGGLEVKDELVVLQEVGAWSEEDGEKSLDESSFEILEYSKSNLDEQSVIA